MEKKAYITPAIVELCVELQQMIAISGGSSVGIKVSSEEDDSSADNRSRRRSRNCWDDE